MRLAKKIAESGIASRREAERLITEGKVTVNGEVVTTPICFVDDSHQITVNGTPLSDQSLSLTVWKLHKPKGYITTKRDPKGRSTVFDLLPNIIDRLLYIGRLDCNSEGLLLFTNNGMFSRQLELPATGLPRSYKVRFHGDLTQRKIKKLEEGITIDGIHYGSIKVQLINHKEFHNKSNNKPESKFSKKPDNRSNNWAILTLKEGKNREIRKVLESLGCTVNRLIRISYGPIFLGNLKPGKLEKLSDSELKKLIKAAKFR